MRPRSLLEAAGCKASTLDRTSAHPTHPWRNYSDYAPQGTQQVPHGRRPPRSIAREMAPPGWTPSPPK